MAGYRWPVWVESLLEAWTGLCVYICSSKYVPEQFRQHKIQYVSTHLYAVIFHQQSAKSKCHLLFSYVLQKFCKTPNNHRTEINGPNISKQMFFNQNTESSEEQIRKWKWKFLTFSIFNFLSWYTLIISRMCSMAASYWQILFPGVSLLVMAQDRVSLVLLFPITVLPFLLDSLMKITCQGLSKSIISQWKD